MSKDSKTRLLVTRRHFLIGSGTFALSLPLVGKALAEEAASPDIKIETPENLFCVYVERATGRVVSAKSFIEVNPEIVNGPQALNPYIAPTRNIAIGSRTPTLFKLDVKRFAIVDIEKRNETLSAFNSLYDAYSPGEFTHHFLLTLADRELGRESLGGWALSKASEAQKATALELLARIHTGYNGELVTGDPEKMAEAVRFYTGRELIRPVLFLGKAPDIGALVFIPAAGLRVASASHVQLAQAGGNAVGGGVAVGMGSNMAKAVSTASQGATSKGVSAIAAAVGASAGVGAGGGGSTNTGGSGSGSSGASSSSSSSGGSSGGCFVAGTKVTLADGSYKAIEAVKIGDKFLGLDGEANEVLGLVTPKLGERLLYGFNDGPVFVTAGHPFRTKSGAWKSIDPAATLLEKAGMTVGKLEIGDVIVTKSGEARIERIHSAKGDPAQTLYDFNLSGNHTYFADSYAVHNKGTCFISGTEVLSADGSSKVIETVEIGDRLLGLDGSINEVLGLVTPKLGERLLYGFNDGPAFVTAGHPFRTKNGEWKSIDPNTTLQEKLGMIVGKLEVGDVIVTKSGNAKIEHIHSAKGDPAQTVYDFNHSGNHTYFANCFAVHNKH